MKYLSVILVLFLFVACKSKKAEPFVSIDSLPMYGDSVHAMYDSNYNNRVGYDGYQTRGHGNDSLNEYYYDSNYLKELRRQGIRTVRTPNGIFRIDLSEQDRNSLRNEWKQGYTPALNTVTGVDTIHIYKMDSAGFAVRTLTDKKIKHLSQVGGNDQSLFKNPWRVSQKPILYNGEAVLNDTLYFIMDNEFKLMVSQGTFDALARQNGILKTDRGMPDTLFILTSYDYGMIVDTVIRDKKKDTIKVTAPIKIEHAYWGGGDPDGITGAGGSVSITEGKDTDHPAQIFNKLRFNYKNEEYAFDLHATEPVYIGNTYGNISSQRISNYNGLDLEKLTNEQRDSLLATLPTSEQLDSMYREADSLIKEGERLERQYTADSTILAALIILTGYHEDTISNIDHITVHGFLGFKRTLYNVPGLIKVTWYGQKKEYYYFLDGKTRCALIKIYNK